MIWSWNGVEIEKLNPMLCIRAVSTVENKWEEGLNKSGDYIWIPIFLYCFYHVIKLHYIYLKHKTDSHSLIHSFLQRKHEFNTYYVLLIVLGNEDTDMNKKLTLENTISIFWLCNIVFIQPTFIQNYLLRMYCIPFIMLRTTNTLMSQNEHGPCFHVIDYEVACTYNNKSLYEWIYKYKLDLEIWC